MTGIPFKRGTGFSIEVTLFSQSNANNRQSSPTLAAGDFKVSKDGGSFTQLETLPTVVSGGVGVITVTFTDTEATCYRMYLQCIDAAGAEWYGPDAMCFLALRQTDDLAYPATSGRSTDIDASGRVLLQPTQTGVTIPTVTTLTNGVTVTTNNDKTGYSLSAAAYQAFWDILSSAQSTAGALGKRIVDYLDAAVSSRSSHTAADVWASGTRTLSSFGTLVADVWANAARTLTAFDWSIITNASATKNLSGTTIKDVTDTLDVVLADGAIDSNNITPAAIAQLASLPGDNDRTFTRGDTVSTTLATLGHTWVSGATMRLSMKPVASFAKDADGAATIGILLTTPAASSADGLVVLNKAAKISAEDRGLASLTRTDGSNTVVGIAGSAFAQVAPGQYKVDVQVIEADGDVVTIVPTCTWTVEADVTRATS